MTRIFDVIFASAVILLFSPIFLLVIPILFLSGEGKIWFWQSRVGRHGQTISILKFATMLEASPNLGAGSITEKNDPRILPVGRFLRKTKINELPQLINIVKGDLAIIGPRPHVKRDLQSISPEVLKIIQSVRPGLSGIGSLIFRDEEKILHSVDDVRSLYDNSIAPYKAELEVWYVARKNLFLDCVLLFLTPLRVFGISNLFLFKCFKDLPLPPKELECLK